jgi:hypothetical protein
MGLNWQIVAMTLGDIGILPLRVGLNLINGKFQDIGHLNPIDLVGEGFLSSVILAQYLTQQGAAA